LSLFAPRELRLFRGIQAGTLCPGFCICKLKITNPILVLFHLEIQPDEIAGLEIY